METQYYAPELQVVGHNSQDTAIESNAYILNHVQTPVRYWVETNPSYGQRVMRQVYCTQTGSWFKAKPQTNYMNIALLFEVLKHIDEETSLRHGTSLTDPIRYTVFNLNTSTAPNDEAIDRLLDYYQFDDYQKEVIENYRKASYQDPNVVKAVPKRGPGRPVSETAEELRKVKLAIAQAKLREIELRNQALELRIVNGGTRAKKSAQQTPVTTVTERLSQHYATTGKPFSPEQLLELRELAFTNPDNMPGKTQPWQLDLWDALKLAQAASERKIHFEQEWEEKLESIDDQERRIALSRTFEKLRPQKLQAEREDEALNARWRDAERLRREVGGEIFSLATNQEALQEELLKEVKP